MRQFFKFFFASFLGTMFGLFMVFFFGFLIIAAIAAVSGSKGKKEVKPNSVLHISLDYDITERTNKNPFDPMNFSFEGQSNPGLFDIVKSIQYAKTDDKIKGIYLDVSMVPSGFATVDAVRNALVDFKTSGKFIVSYGEMISQKGYYLASVADEVYMNPVGYMDLTGFRTELMFFKGALEKLEVEPQIIYCGKYKSATEPFRLDKMSDENREQISYIINDIYARFIKNISESRKLTEAEVDSIADNMLVRDAEDAVKYKLVDGLLFYDQVIAKLKEKTGTEEKDKLPHVSLDKYIDEEAEEKKHGKDRIAVLFAEGSIVDGKGEEDNIGSERFAKAIREIREDEKVKALVFRINSGGGSALASDVILREIELTKAKMPIIVSMGDVAASGGYYIACKADTIVAEPNTITGSIGVFGMLLNMQNFFNNKLGITFDGVKTGKYSDIGTISRPLTAEERMIIQAGVDSIYLDFKEHVAKGRGVTVEFVDSIGQGRVWTGVQAKERGLVDVLGNLDDAVKIAAEKAGLTDYSLKSYPKQKDPFEMLLENFGAEAETFVLKRKLGEQYPVWKKLEEMKTLNGVQARMPFELEIY
ncbi:MAG: signal peptide peptidase SppA [Chitinophagales bacterium]|nr:signal peptide peptidase SppA [Chitinophagales bacterium]